MDELAYRGAIEAVLAGRRARDVESAVLDFKTVGRSREDTLVDLAEMTADMKFSPLAAS